MREVSLNELRQIAIDSKYGLWKDANNMGRDVKIYLHWSAGHYSQFFKDYHINIDYDGSIYVSTDDLSVIKAHTFKRNTGSVGIAMACGYNANTNDLGPEAPTQAQIEVMSKVINVLCKSLDLTIDKERVMTHAEAANNEDGLYLHEPYGPNSGDPETRWDLAILKDYDEFGTGGEILRGKAIWYNNQE